jgi:hypothetical protein
MRGALRADAEALLSGFFADRRERD